MSQIKKLVTAIVANAEVLELAFQSFSIPEPSDEPLSSLEFPSLGPKVAKSRVALLSAIHELDRVVQSPVEYFRNFSQGCLETGCIRTLIAFNVPEIIPLDGTITYEELSEKTALSIKVLKTLVRASTLSVGFLREDNQGRICHTVASSIFNSRRGQQDRAEALKWQTYAMLNCGANLEKALRTDPSAQDDHASAFAVAHRGPNGETPNFWEYLEQNPEMGTWFHSAMRIVTTYPMRSTDHLVKGYSWANLHCKEVVEIGGSHGQISAAIAKKNPCITFVAQDLVEVVEEGNRTANLPPNVSLEVANFFEPQPRIADAYLYRTIFHDWGDKHCKNILRSLVPALRHGACVIAEEIVLPPHKSIPSFGERNFRRADLIMTSLFNGRERSLEEYIELFKEVEDRLVFQKCINPPGSITSIMEWIFEDPENNNAQFDQIESTAEEASLEMIGAPSLAANLATPEPQNSNSAQDPVFEHSDQILLGSIRNDILPREASGITGDDHSISMDGSEALGMVIALKMGANLTPNTGTFQQSSAIAV